MCALVCNLKLNTTIWLKLDSDEMQILKKDNQNKNTWFKLLIYEKLFVFT